MAGSYQHCVDDEGRLFEPEILAQQLENGGDVYEAVEEMYGMIWYLADQMSDAVAHGTGLDVPAADLVEEARIRHADGLTVSPGVRGE